MVTIPKSPKAFSDLIGNSIKKLVFSNKCIEDLGCFYTGPPFYHPTKRPVSLPPFGLNKIKTKLLLFTPLEKENGIIMKPNVESLTKSSYDLNLPVKFLTHGFLISRENRSNAFYRMKDALLEQGDYNVFVVDWTGSSGPPYAQAVSNTRVVGAQIAQMIKFLQKETGLDPKNVHLIGHSLGAHASGYAGKRVSNLRRISGLDPAGPFFRMEEPKIRLDRSDAEFLDIIHTNMGSNVYKGVGIEEAIGHIDFYPNGGTRQFGCEQTLLNFTDAGRNIITVLGVEGVIAVMASSCNHNRAIELYIASIKITSCKFMGTQCEDYEKYEKGECKDNLRIEMGFFAKKDPAIPEGEKYYLKTGREFPFCLEFEQ